MAESAEPSLKIHVRWYHLIQIYTFNFECPLELIESENHYCLTGKEGEECCTDDFETFSRRFSKGCVDNCPYERDTTEWSWHILCRIRPEISPLKPDDKCDGADRGPFDDAIFYKDVQFDYCCSEDAFCGYGWLAKYWYWIVIVVVIGGIIGIVFCIVDKTCGSNEQARISIIYLLMSSICWKTDCFIFLLTAKTTNTASNLCYTTSSAATTTTDNCHQQ